MFRAKVKYATDIQEPHENLTRSRDLIFPWIC